MKRMTALLLTGLMLLSLLAGCGGAKTDGTNFTWTREGTFVGADGNYLVITPPDAEKTEGWGAAFMRGEETLDGFVAQEGETLHGGLVYEDSDEYIVTVTISEEGENGLLLEIEDGETYHFTSMEMPEATVAVHIDTEGLGQIAYAKEGEEPEFDDEYPAQSAQLNLEGPEAYVLGAKADEGWKFVKWTKDGADYSFDEQITVVFTEAETELTAVFDKQ